jgi:hypothetical protein
MEDDFPPIPKKLVDTLEELLPEKCPTLTMTDREIWFYAGKREVVRILKDHFNKQNETILTSNP